MIVKIVIRLAVDEPARHRQVLPRRRCQLSATHGRSAPNVVVLVKLVENDVLTKKRRSAIAGIGSPSLENVLVVFEREVTLFQDQVPLGQIERDAAPIVIAGVSQLIVDR